MSRRFSLNNSMVGCAKSRVLSRIRLPAAAKNNYQFGYRLQNCTKPEVLQTTSRHPANFEGYDGHGMAMLSLAVTNRMDRILHLALKWAISLHQQLRTAFRAPIVPPVPPDLARTQHDSLRRHGALSERRSRCWANCCLPHRLAWARKHKAWQPYTILWYLLSSRKSACGRCEWSKILVYYGYDHDSTNYRNNCKTMTFSEYRQWHRNMQLVAPNAERCASWHEQ